MAAGYKRTTIFVLILLIFLANSARANDAHIADKQIEDFIYQAIQGKEKVIIKWNVPLQIGFNGIISDEDKEIWLKEFQSKSDLIHEPVSFASRFDDANLRIYVTDDIAKTMLDYKQMIMLLMSIDESGFERLTTGLLETRSSVAFLFPGKTQILGATIFISATQGKVKNFRNVLHCMSLAALTFAGTTDAIKPSWANRNLPDKLADWAPIDIALTKVIYSSSIGYAEPMETAAPKLVRLLRAQVK